MANIKSTTSRNHQRIDSSRKTMFIFVAGAAFVTGVSLVVSLFLVKQIFFQGKVFIEKQATISTLDRDVDNIKKLKDNLRVLETSTALNSIKLKEEVSPLQAVLDALPDVSNADALGASIQEKFVGRVEGLSIDGLIVGGEANDAGSNGLGDHDSHSTDSGIPFLLTVRGSAKNMQDLLRRFEKSIRVIKIDLIDVQASGNSLIMKVQGSALYQAKQEIKLETKVLKP